MLVAEAPSMRRLASGRQFSVRYSYIDDWVRDVTAVDNTHRVGAVEIFLSYAHEDKKFRDLLINGFVGAQSGGLVKLWADREIPTGDPWRREIDAHLETAHVILAMVTPSFVKSTFCCTDEMGRARQRHDRHDAEVIPLYVDYASLIGTPIHDLQYFPSDDPPLSKRRDQARVLKTIVDHVLGRVEALQVRRSKMPIVWNVGQPVDRFVGRADDIDQIRTQFRQKSKRTRCQQIAGADGLGKSAMVTEYAWRHRADYDVVWWTSGDRKSTLEADLEELAKKLTKEQYPDQLTAVNAARTWLANAKNKMRWLLIVDNAAEDVVTAVLPDVFWGDVLITSEMPFTQNGVVTHTLSALTVEEAISFIHSQSGDTDRDAALELYELTGGQPLELVHAVDTIRAEGTTIERYVYRYRTTPNG